MRKASFRKAHRGAVALLSSVSLVGVALAQSYVDPYEPYDTGADYATEYPAETYPLETGGGETPLEASFTDLPGLTPANMLPKGAVLGYAGQQQANPAGSSGTGNQLYTLGLEAATSDRLSFGIAYDKFADPIAIGGVPDGIREMLTVGVHGKFRYFDNGTVQMGVLGAVNWLRLSSGYYGTTADDGSYAIGAIQAPVTVDVGPRLQFHLTPGVSVFPDSINGRDFYGTVPYIGGGVTFQAAPRLGIYGLVNVPFGANGNTIAPSGAMKNVPVWTAGARYLVTPKAALDLYVTNGFGATPATEILTFYPDGDETLVGLRLSYTPGWEGDYPSSYRGARPLTARERRLQFPGLTLASADTLDPGLVALSATYGTDGHYNYGAAFSPDQDIEFGLHVERLADDGSRVPPLKVGTDDETRWLVSAKLRFLDQNNGSPFTMSGNLALGREFDTRFGVVHASLPMSYKFGDRIAATAEPKFAAYGSTELYGLGLGMNAELYEGLDLIAEVTPMAGEDMTWAAGARYTAGNASFEVKATNTAGDFGVATMLAQDDVRYSVGVRLALDAGPFWRGLF